MFEPRCPGCNYQVNLNSNYKCPKCGYKFWNSKAAYIKNKKLNPEPISSVKEMPKATKKTYQSNKSNNSIILFIAAVFVSAFIVMALYFVIGVYTEATDKCNSIGTSQILYCRFNYYHWLTSSCLLAIFIFLGFRRLGDKRDGNSQSVKNKRHNKTICPTCNKKVDDDSKYCIYCGSKI